MLDRYISQFATKYQAELFCDEKRVEQALLDYFTSVATCFTSKETPSGCFLISTSAALAASSNEIGPDAEVASRFAGKPLCCVSLKSANSAVRSPPQRRRRP
ncbi:putative HTH-type transcriptional regulator [Pseudescherichia vulneris]|nr:putative HTH-type transcriptional regulator [Pseudescherichia vulneris]